jgi:hypothetical protein
MPAKVRERPRRCPRSEMGVTFILDVILHQDLKHAKDKFRVYGSAMRVLVGSGMSLRPRPDHEVINRSQHAVLRGHQETGQKTLLTNF